MNIGDRLCFETKRMYIPNEGWVMLICTERLCHVDRHYDDIYSMEWE